MSTALLDAVVKKNRARLIPFMLALYVLAFLDRSNIGFAKQTYQIDTGLSNEAYALGAGIFFVVYAFLGVPANLLMRKLGARTWIGTTTLLWGFLSAAMAWADTEAKFLIVRTLLGAAEAGFFPGMIYLTSQWFPQRNRASIMGLFYMGAPLALTLGSPLSGAKLEQLNGCKFIILRKYNIQTYITASFTLYTTFSRKLTFFNHLFQLAHVLQIEEYTPFFSNTSCRNIYHFFRFPEQTKDS